MILSLLTGAILVAYLGFGAPLIAAVLKSELRAAGLQLDELEFTPELRLPVRIERLAVSSPTGSLSLDDVEILPTPDWDYEISIAAVRLYSELNAAAHTANEPAPSPQDLLPLMGWLPSAGAIESWQICSPTCLIGQLHWRHGLGTVRLLQPRGASLDFVIKDNVLELSTTLEGFPSAVGNVAVSLENELISLQGQAAMVANGTRYDFQSPVVTGIDFRVAALGLDLDIPIETALDLESIFPALRGQIDVESSQQWSVTRNDLGLGSSNTFNGSLALTDAGPRLVLNAPFAVELNLPGLRNSALLIDGGSQCDVVGFSEHVIQCGIVNATFNSAIAESGMEFDTNLAGLQIRYDTQTAVTEITAATRFNLRVRDEGVIIGSLSGAASFVDGLLEADTSSAAIAGIQGVGFSLRHDAHTAEGTLTGTVTVPLEKIDSIFNDLTAIGIVIDSGSASVTGNMTWARDLIDVGFKLGATDLTMAFDTHALRGGRFKFEGALTGMAMAALQDGVLRDIDASGWFDLRLFDGERTIAAIGSDINIRQGFLQTSTDKAKIHNVDKVGLGIEYDLENQTGRLNARGAVSLKKLATILPEYVPPDTEFARGTVSSDASIKWAPGQFDISAVLRATNVELTWDGYTIDGGHLEVKAAGWPLVEARQSTLEIGRMDIGLPIDDIRAIFDLALDTESGMLTVEGHDFAAAILGGRAQSRDFHYVAPAGLGHIQMDLTDVQLEQILALQPETISGSGTLSGSVPIQVRENIVSIRSGTLRSIQGGLIRYQPGDGIATGTAGNNEMKMLLAALSDFHYHGLDAGLTYDESGLMNTDIALKGHNPAFQNGREIHLNLTLQENIATLLESLRVGDAITDKIGQQRKQESKK